MCNEGVMLIKNGLVRVQNFDYRHGNIRRLVEILIYFLAFLPSVIVSVTASPAAAVGPTDMIFGIFIAYISVIKFTPLAVTGPHGQLASTTFF